MEHAFFFLRDPAYLKDLSDDLIPVYTNAAERDPARADKALNEWKSDVIPKTGRPVYTYSAGWDPGASTPEIALPLSVPTSAPEGSDIWDQAFSSWRERWARAGVAASDGGFIECQELAPAH